MASDITPPPPPPPSSSAPPPPPPAAPPIDPPPEYLRQPRDHDAPVEVAAKAGNGRGFGFAFLALLTVGVFGVAIWFAYQQGVRRGVQMAPPLIRADSGPVKVKPEKPGGMEVPHQDKTVYDRLSGQPKPVEAEKLLPPPEAVVEKPLAIVRDADSPEAPPEVKTEPVTAAATLPQVPEAPVAAKPVPPQPVKQPEPKVEETVAAAPEPDAKPPAAPEVKLEVKPEPKPVAAARQPAQPATAPVTSATDYLIQVGAYRTPKAAQAGWTRLVGANKALLGSLKPIVVRADLGSRGIYHRLRAGPVDGAEAANALCARLKQRKVGCLVIKP